MSTWLPWKVNLVPSDADNDTSGIGGHTGNSMLLIPWAISSQDGFIDTLTPLLDNADLGDVFALLICKIRASILDLSDIFVMY